MAGTRGLDGGRRHMGRRRLRVASVFLVALFVTLPAGGPAALAMRAPGADAILAAMEALRNQNPTASIPVPDEVAPPPPAPAPVVAPVPVTPATIVAGPAPSAPSTRAGGANAAAMPAQQPPPSVAAAGSAITFSEFPVGTAITTQYQSQGVAFGGASPFITTDSANPTSPVLSGTPVFQGEIRINVVDPVSGATTTTTGVRLDVGYIDSPNSVEVEYYGSDGRRFGAVRANARGINTLTIPVRGVALLIVSAVEEEPAGFAIDNVEIGVESPAVRPSRMVAFGDSFTSGEGLIPGGVEYDCGTDLHKATYYENSNVRPSRYFDVPEGRSDPCDTVTQGPLPDDYHERSLEVYENLCHRHGDAWPNDVRGRLGLNAPSALFVACSGALTKHVGFLDSGNEAKEPLSPQGVAGGQTQRKNAEDFKAAGGTVDFVTIGIGGNDAGFVDIITDCVFSACLNREGAASSAVATINQTVYPRLVTTFLGIRGLFPDATVLAYGYPSVLAANRSDCVPGLGTDEVVWAQQTLLPALNQAVADAAAIVGITFMPLADVTRGHEACATDAQGNDAEWINHLRGGDDRYGVLGNESLHPNQHAHRAIADHFMAHYTDGNGNLTFSNPPANPTIRPPSQPITLVYGAVNASPVGPCGAGCLQPACAPEACELQVGVENFSPFTPLTVTLNSEPVVLGSLVTDANGTAGGTFGVPASVPDGEHLLTIEGVSPDDVDQVGNRRVYVKRLQPAGVAFVPPACTTTLTGDVIGPFTVLGGDHLCVENARVVGPVTVGAGGAFSATGSQVSGGVVSAGAVYVRLCGTAVSQSGLEVTGSSGPVIVGDPGQGCAGNRLVGVNLTGNGAGATMSGNTVFGQARFDRNAGGTNTVAANTLASGALNCSANDPPPVNAGQANTAPLGKTGQCAAL